MLKQFCFSIWVFFHEHSRITGQQRKGEAISLIPLYQFHLLHRFSDISLEFAAESLHPRRTSSRIQREILGFRVQVANH